jgi:hypothetical protein
MALTPQLLSISPTPDTSGKYVAYMQIVDDSGKVVRQFDTYYDPNSPDDFTNFCNAQAADEEDKAATQQSIKDGINGIIGGALATMAASRAAARTTATATKTTTGTGG